MGKGAVVEVDFAGRRARGVVVSPNGVAPLGVKVAPVNRVVEELPAQLVDLALWIADYYGSTPARALGLVAPFVRRRRGERRRRSNAKRSPVRPFRRLTDDQVRSVSASSVRWTRLWARTSCSTVRRAAARPRSTSRRAAALERGLGAIVLVPEIALTPQAAGRFRARFGEGLAILHSALTDAERRDERERIARGARIVVGALRRLRTRARAGADLRRRGARRVVQAGVGPRYDARTVAAKRAALEGAVAVYGSATPRPESWERLERLELTERSGALCRRCRSSTCAARRGTRCRRRCSRSSARSRRPAARRSCC